MKPLTMVQLLRSQASGLGRVACSLLAVALAWSMLSASLPAAGPPVHFEHADSLPTGAIGSAQLLRGGPLPGYFQPVEIKGPPGALVSTSETGEFSAPQRAPLVLGMLIGSVYRLRVTNIPNQEGQEVFPTIEVINRLYPPVGLENKFPIPIDLTQEELEIALSGRFVTRVIYLEEPNAALPIAQKPGDQSYFEVGDGENPLDVADTLGRPMAILRLGGRVPDAEGADATFLYNSPPLVRWKPAPKQNQAPSLGPLAQKPPGAVRQATATSGRRVTIIQGTPKP
jgi:hypothetical protein